MYTINIQNFSSFQHLGHPLSQRSAPSSNLPPTFTCCTQNNFTTVLKCLSCRRRKIHVYNTFVGQGAKFCLRTVIWLHKKFNKLALSFKLWYRRGVAAHMHPTKKWLLSGEFYTNFNFKNMVSRRPKSNAEIRFINNKMVQYWDCHS